MEKGEDRKVLLLVDEKNSHLLGEFFPEENFTCNVVKVFQNEEKTLKLHILLVYSFSQFRLSYFKEFKEIFMIFDFDDMDNSFLYHADNQQGIITQFLKMEKDKLENIVVEVLCLVTTNKCPIFSKIDNERMEQVGKWKLYNHAMRLVLRKELFVTMKIPKKLKYDSRHEFDRKKFKIGEEEGDKKKGKRVPKVFVWFLVAVIVILLAVVLKNRTSGMSSSLANDCINDLKILKSANTKLSNSLNEKVKQLETKNEEYETLKSHVDGFTKIEDIFENQKKSLNDEIAVCKKENEDLEEKINKNHQVEVTKLNEEIKESKEEIKELKKEIKELKKDRISPAVLGGLMKVNSFCEETKDIRKEITQRKDPLLALGRGCCKDGHTLCAGIYDMCEKIKEI